MSDGNDFYVGYQKQAPKELASYVRSRIFLYIGGVMLAAALVAWSHRAYHPATFEFGNARMFEGIIAAEPYPSLLITRPGTVNELAPFSRFILVAPGKFGADKLIVDYVGKSVVLKGSLVYQDGRSMIEVEPGSVSAINSESSRVSAGHELGEYTLHGEIVDSKCYLGVMNPGNLKTHKACAIRCISGGIPPVLLVRNAEDNTALYFLLVDEEGGAVNKRVLDMIAEPVTITGEVTQEDDLLILKANPEDYLRNL